MAHGLANDIKGIKQVMSSSHTNIIVSEGLLG